MLSMSMRQLDVCLCHVILVRAAGKCSVQNEVQRDHQHSQFLAYICLYSGAFITCGLSFHCATFTCGVSFHCATFTCGLSFYCATFTFNSPWHNSKTRHRHKSMLHQIFMGLHHASIIITYCVYHFFFIMHPTDDSTPWANIITILGYS